MKKIAVTGPNGLIGSRIIELLTPHFQILPLTHSELDITNEQEVDKKLSALDFDLLLHLAGYTNVEGAETEKELATLLNVTGTKNIVHSVQKNGKEMIYISTDFVFDGVNPPFDESSSPNPLGFYAKTKYEGEIVVKDKAMILRISFPYGNTESKKPDFVHRIKSLLQEGKEMYMIEDASITPTFIDDIGMSLKYLIDNYQPEIYHVVGSESVSPYESGKMIAKHFKLAEDLVLPISFSEYIKGKAPRPQHSKIVSSKNTFHSMKSFHEGLHSIQPPSSLR